MSRDKLQASEQCKEMLRAQLVVLTDELNEAHTKTENYLAQIKDFADKEKRMDMEREEFSQVDIPKTIFGTSASLGFLRYLRILEILRIFSNFQTQFLKE